MLFTSAVTAGLLAIATRAHPMPRQATAGLTDTAILNFALTLEHLENAFYSGALSKFTTQDFVNAGMPAWVYGRFSQVAAHEASHVEFLTGALGDAATKPCTYKFPYTDPASFVSVSRALETVGTSAYTGAAKFIENKDYLLAAATVLVTEARHSSWIDGAVRHDAAWAGPYETPLDLNQVFTIASAFIESCPDSNPALPVKAYPALSVPATATPGAQVDVSFTPAQGTDTSKLFGVFLHGQNTTFVELSGNSVQIPQELRGTTYLLISSDGSTLSDNSTVAGPAVLNFSYDSNGDLVKLPF